VPEPLKNGPKIRYLAVARWVVVSAVGTIWLLSRGEPNERHVVAALLIASMSVAIVVWGLIARSRPSWSADDAEVMRAKLRSLVKPIAIACAILLAALVVWLMATNNT
jgi:hypothetical protein